MAWLNLVISSKAEEAEDIASQLSELGALSVSLEDAGDTPRLQSANEAQNLWPATRVLALLPGNTDVQDLVKRLEQSIGHALNYEIQKLEDQDWSRSWMDRYEPLIYGNRLCVCPSWLTPPAEIDTVIELDPGQAFGTGTHETTSLCLEALLELNLQGKTVLDYGCGSGILAIAALKLGAEQAWAVDIDPQALNSARENARQNGVGSKIQVIQPRDLPQDLLVDLVVANILAGPLTQLVNELTRHLKSGGMLLLSGLLNEQIAEVEQAYVNYFRFSTKEKNDWILLQGTR